MEYLTTKETAKKWGVNVSLVRRYCTQERIPGVIQRDGAWLIPEDAKRPMKIEPGVKEPVVLPALAQKLLRQKKKKSFHGLYDYVQINLTYSSCRMASNRLTRQQVETIFTKGKVSVSFEPMKVSDLVEVLNHCVCVDYILDHAQEHCGAVLASGEGDNVQLRLFRCHELQLRRHRLSPLFLLSDP